MSALRPGARAASRGQTIVLGAVTLLILALVVAITFGVAVSIHQKIKIQNHADAQAYSLAVQQARALNYFVYTNRAIASSYVGMANLHAYMSEAAMLSDIKAGAAEVFFQIAAQEDAQCWCCAFICVPCRPQHCLHSIQARLNAVLLGVEWLSGSQGRTLQRLDEPGRRVMDALDRHILALRASQDLVRVQVTALVGSGSFGQLLDENMQGAAGVAQNHTMTVMAQNLAQWNALFYGDTARKRRIMAEVANATRHPFTWNRTGPGAQQVLFPPNFLASQIRPRLGPRGEWTVIQTPEIAGMLAGGRTGFTSGDFPGQALGVVIAARDAPASTAHGRTLHSYDWGTLWGRWNHGVGTGVLPLLGPAGAAQYVTGDGNTHRVNNGLLPFNSPHSGRNHNLPLNMDRFMEFDIGRDRTFRQPAVYAAASTDSRVTEHGIRGPWELNDTGTVRVSTTDSEPVGELTIGNARRTRSVSKAQVYYHRIGDWSDYPNLFNPYWRAKLHPLTRSEVMSVVAPVDANAAAIAGPLAGSSRDLAASVNVAVP